jgi:serine/threonine protein kinase
VWKVFHKKYKRVYALKEMSKAKVIDKKSERSIRYEKELLSRINHPFIVNMNYAFQDTNNLYLVMDFLSGGDLRYHVFKHKRFTEEQTKFFVACVLLGLDYLHSNNIIHRDIKPENLVLDDRGYVRITDFGIAKVYQKENSQETSGTPGYMAPEVMYAKNHTIAVDYFALGVLTYEFMCGVVEYIIYNIL